VGEKLEWDIYNLSGEQTSKLPFFRFGNIIRFTFAVWFIFLFVALGVAMFNHNPSLASGVSRDELTERTISNELPSYVDMIEGTSLSNRSSEISEHTTELETSNGSRQLITERLQEALNVYFEDFYEKRILHYRDNVLHNIDRLRGKD